MLTARRLAAILLALIVVLLIPLAVWVGGGEKVLLSAATYKDGLKQQNIYPDIIPVALPALTQMMMQAHSPEASPLPPDLIQVVSQLSPDAWRTVSKALIPADWLQMQTEGALDGLMKWLNGESDTLTGTVDTTTLRERIASPQGQQAINQIIVSAPACASDQVAQLDALSQGQNVTLPICHPPEPYLPLSQTRLTATFNELVDHIQNQPPMIQMLAEGGGNTSQQSVGPQDSGPQNSGPGLAGLRLLVQVYQKLVGVIYLCPAAFLALMVALMVRSFKGFSRWIGWTWIAAGVIALIPLLLLPYAIAGNLSASLLETPSQDPQTRLFVARLTTGLMVSAFNQFSGPVVFQVALLILLGAGSLGVAAYLRSRPAPAAGAAPPISTASARRTTAAPLPPDKPNP